MLLAFINVEREDGQQPIELALVAMRVFTKGPIMNKAILIAASIVAIGASAIAAPVEARDGRGFGGAGIGLGIAAGALAAGAYGAYGPGYGYGYGSGYRPRYVYGPGYAYGPGYGYGPGYYRPRHYRYY